MLRHAAFMLPHAALCDVLPSQSPDQIDQPLHGGTWCVEQGLLLHDMQLLLGRTSFTVGRTWCCADASAEGPGVYESLSPQGRCSLADPANGAQCQLHHCGTHVQAELLLVERSLLWANDAIAPLARTAWCTVRVSQPPCSRSQCEGALVPSYRTVAVRMHLLTSPDAHTSRALRAARRMRQYNVQTILVHFLSLFGRYVEMASPSERGSHLAVAAPPCRIMGAVLLPTVPASAARRSPASRRPPVRDAMLPTCCSSAVQGSVSLPI